jgi:para-aminobenzoate synthetase component II
MLLIIDNYDSFVFNIARYFEELGAAVRVVRNDAITIGDVRQIKPSAIVISPGPCTPAEAGVSLAVVRELSGVFPILGICLGHQCIGAAFDGKVARAREPMHGRVSNIDHRGKNLFFGLPAPLQVGRYHSLVVESRPEMERSLQIDARSERGEIMALSHTSHPTFGVQFHPESILTVAGHQLLKNFLELAERRRRAAPE